MFRSLSLALCFMLTAVSLVAQNKEQGRLENAGLVMEEINRVHPRDGAPAEEVSVNAGRWAAGQLRAASTESAHRWVSRPSVEFSLVRLQPPSSRSWIGRHPVWFGTLVGVGGGFLIGYLPGDDAVFDDGAAGFNGLVIGGVGAGVGAAIGAFVGTGR